MPGDSPRFDLYDGRSDSQSLRQKTQEITDERVPESEEGFWARGYFVSTVGLNEDVVRAYIRHQEHEDDRQDQMKLGV